MGCDARRHGRGAGRRPEAPGDGAAHDGRQAWPGSSGTWRAGSPRAPEQGRNSQSSLAGDRPARSQPRSAGTAGGAGPRSPWQEACRSASGPHTRAGALPSLLYPFIRALYPGLSMAFLSSADIMSALDKLDGAVRGGVIVDSAKARRRKAGARKDRRIGRAAHLQAVPQSARGRRGIDGPGSVRADQVRQTRNAGPDAARRRPQVPGILPALRGRHAADGRDRLRQGRAVLTGRAPRTAARCGRSSWRWPRARSSTREEGA